MRNLRMWDPRNPVSTAKLVGITVSEIVGVGCDLVTNSAAVIALSVSLSSQVVLVGDVEMNMVIPYNGWGAMCYPLTIFSVGVIASLLTFFIATNIATPWSYRHLDRSFGLQQLISTVLLYPLIMGMAYGVLPSRVTLVDTTGLDKASICCILYTWVFFFIALLYCVTCSGQSTNLQFLPLCHYCIMTMSLIIYYTLYYVTSCYVTLNHRSIPACTWPPAWWQAPSRRSSSVGSPSTTCPLRHPPSRCSPR